MKLYLKFKYLTLVVLSLAIALAHNHASLNRRVFLQTQR